MKALLIAVPILLIGGVLGAGFMGVVDIPGVTPKKAEAKAQAQYQEAADPVADATTTETDTSTQDDTTGFKPPVVSDVETNPVKGTTAIAKIWAELPAQKVVEISGDYKDEDLAAILLQMPKQNTAQVLSTLPADRAARLSKEMQRQASIVPES
ncbi:MAG TPA: hypothetical protein VNI20_12755 [Fimbriimonadaceae bacterium]|nr:hypothetical protein [Fimbriimonadaceae bacterium]